MWASRHLYPVRRETPPAVPEGGLQPARGFSPAHITLPSRSWPGCVQSTRRLGIPTANVGRLSDLKHHSRLDQIEAALKAVGKELTTRIRDAA
jgi:hypothetical protein